MRLSRLLSTAVTCAIIAGSFAVSSPVHAEPPSAGQIQACIPASEDAPKRFGGARPESIVLQETPLLTQPPFAKEAKPITLVTIPANARVIVFDTDNVIRDKNKKWFRVLWVCDDFSLAGWVPREVVNFKTRANEMVAPPACAVSLATVDSIKASWKSTEKGKISVVIDVFRNPSTTTINNSFFFMTRNGKEIRDKDRKVQTSGPFLLSGLVIQQEVSKGTVVGFKLSGSSKEEPRFFATIYLVPKGCEWPI